MKKENINFICHTDKFYQTLKEKLVPLQFLPIEVQRTLPKLTVQGQYYPNTETREEHSYKKTIDQYLLWI